MKNEIAVLIYHFFDGLKSCVWCKEKILLKVWKEYKELNYDEKKFPTIGEKFEKEFTILEGCVGEAHAKLI